MPSKPLIAKSMPANPYRAIPSLEQMLQRKDMQSLVAQYGHAIVRDALRVGSEALRGQLAGHEIDDDAAGIPDTLAKQTTLAVVRDAQSSHIPVFNLTGTLLHTNLGRAVLPQQALQALQEVGANPSTVEFDLSTGKRGDRDQHLEGILCKLTGAQSATIVNNNAAAVLLSLNTLARGRDVLVSRGELIEIGGSFRMPEIMASAGCQLKEVGTTNRTHLHDYQHAIDGNTAALMTVHPSNYQIQGFTATVDKKALAELAREKSVPFIDDLGSGTLIDLDRFGLPHETTVREALDAGADIVMFSGDKLLGGPQCGIIVGRADLIEQIKANPMKRAMRVDKLILAALEAVLRLYLAPEKLHVHLPVMRLLGREKSDIDAGANRVMAHFQQNLGEHAHFDVVDCMSQIGSGAMPVEHLASAAIAIKPRSKKESDAAALMRWAKALRGLPKPVIGRVAKNALLLDMRALQDEAAFIEQLGELETLLAQPIC